MSDKCDATETFHSWLHNLQVSQLALDFWEASIPVPSNILLHVLSCCSQHNKKQNKTKKNRSGGLEQLMFYIFKHI